MIEKLFEGVTRKQHIIFWGGFSVVEVCIAMTTSGGLRWFALAILLMSLFFLGMYIWYPKSWRLPRDEESIKMKRPPTGPGTALGLFISYEHQVLRVKCLWIAQNPEEQGAVCEMCSWHRDPRRASGHLSCDCTTR